MQHIQIAYELGVIMIGFATLTITGFWALKTRESYLRDFCLLYFLFTVVLVIAVIKKYLSINIAGYSGRTWYIISAVGQMLNFAVIVAAVQVLFGVYQIKAPRVINLVLVAAMLVCYALIFSPIGAVLDADKNAIQFGIGYQIASGWYFVSFTFALVFGYGWIRRVWRTDKKAFIVGLLLFATIGYAETLINLFQTLHTPIVFRASEPDFLYSSIPFALYGIFLILFFLRYSAPFQRPARLDELPEIFLEKYGITEREREIIQKVIQGKSNADIASELFISLATVKTHLHNIYTKIGADSRYDLLARIRSGQ